LPREWFADFGDVIRFNEPLSQHTSFGIGGPAAVFATPGTVGEVEGLLEACERRGVPWRVLGAGTNVLVRDAGFPGVVVRLSPKGFGRVECHGDDLHCGAAASLAAVVQMGCRERGDRAYAALAGIPGTVGGAVRMNAGGRHGWIGPLVRSVRVLDRPGPPRWVPASDLDFGYRHSSLAGTTVLEVRLAVDAQSAAAGDRSPARQEYESILSEKRRTQPRQRSAGCVFANPTDASGVRQSAGLLIDRAHMKGAAVGAAAVSDVHANFIVNTESATADDVLSLIERIRDRVKSVHGLDLTLEIEIW